MNLKKSLVRRINFLLKMFDCEITKKRSEFYLHEYSSYEEYKATQIFHNKRKIDTVWADEDTLDAVISRAKKEFNGKNRLFALCHGTRNGFEQNYIASKIDVDILGTDISDTARNYPRSVQWDFHDQNNDWVEKCDFIYTNSLDQSWKPKSALSTWLGQLRSGGLLFIEHTDAHGPDGASEMDPFGATPQYMAYLLCEWFGHLITTEIIKGKKARSEKEFHLFVVKKL